MKTTSKLLIVTAFFALLFTNSTVAQEAATPQYYTITTMHWNMENNDSTWVATEKEYLEKITKKNQYIMGAGYYLHRWTEDNTELKYVQVYGSWDDINNAATRNSELEKEAWPNEKARADFLKKQNNFYSVNHSDEIYAVLPGSKPLSSDFTEDKILYYQTQHFTFPKDGSTEEFGKLNKEFQENVIHKNELIKGYYPHMHSWGADRTEYMQAFFLDSMDDLENMGDRSGELVRAHWKDAESRKAFFEKFNKYTTGVHSDKIYTAVAELRK
jgi:siroheme synthase (precorrin-2 oxidase/ferrochelatase)